MDIKEISKRNYLATVKRGLITQNTSFWDFIAKIEEETTELKCAESEENEREELADIVLVCFAMAEHYGIDLVSEMEKKALYNEQRKD